MPISPEELKIAAAGFNRLATDPRVPPENADLLYELAASAMVDLEFVKEQDRGLGLDEIEMMRRYVKANPGLITGRETIAEQFDSYLSEQERFSKAREKQDWLQPAEQEPQFPDIGPFFKAAMKNPTLAAKHAALNVLQVTAEIAPMLLWAGLMPGVFFGLNDSYANTVPQDLHRFATLAEIMIYIGGLGGLPNFINPRINRIADRVRAKLPPLISDESPQLR